MMAKGPIGAVAPALALGSHWLLKKDWQKIFNLKWLIAMIIVLILLMPMCYGLYKQFGFEGIKFFFWTQSFGRITGENVWKMMPDISSFYTHLCGRFYLGLQ